MDWNRIRLCEILESCLGRQNTVHLRILYLNIFQINKSKFEITTSTALGLTR